MPIRAPLAPLRALAEGERFFALDRLEQYFHGHQDAHKMYDWEGRFVASGLSALADYSALVSGYYVSYSQRRPSVRYDLPRTIVSRLTQMSLGGEMWPELNVEGDDDAQAAIRAWSKAMCLQQRISEAREFGGATGTAVVSLGIAEGAFRVDVHDPKHVLVLEWERRAEFRPSIAMKAYSYRLDEYDQERKRVMTHAYWFVELWSASEHVVWEKVPEKLAELADWQDRIDPSHRVTHGFGFCPVFWAQNLPDSQELDGRGDYEGTEHKVDEINRLLSATTRGAIANVDPTLVIRSEDEESSDPVKKGSGAVIYAPNGAEYLEMEGTAVAAARELLGELRQTVLEECQVVLPREDKITGAAQSAAAMRILYAPMIARCNQLRDQYGQLICQVLKAVLQVARERSIPRSVPRQDGAGVEPIVQKFVVDLPLGEGSDVSLRWPPYFAPTQQDIKDTVATAQAASGSKAVISHRTAVDYVARLFGVADIDAEIQAIEDDSAQDAERQKEIMGAMTPGAAEDDGGSEDDDDSEE